MVYRNLYTFAKIFGMRTFDVVVTGGGPAGLMAAGTAASAGRNVLLAEKMEKPARKLRITGKGRCNLTNARDTARFLEKIRTNREFARAALRAFSNRDAMDFFERIGLPLSVERGDRVFPASGKAWDVAEALVRWVRKSGAEIRCDTRVREIGTLHGRIASVILEYPNGRTQTVRTSNLIIATGGLSYPATGSTGDGYDLAHALGHRIEGIRPALVPLETESEYVRALKGLHLRNVNVTLLIDGHPVGSEFGEMEFYEYGLSGPVILRLSREAVDALIEERKTEVSIDLKPALSMEKLTARIERERPGLPAKATVADLLRKLLPQPLIRPVSRQAGIAPDCPLSRFGYRETERLIRTLKDFRLPVTDYRPFTEAIVTAGGVDVSEIDPETLESKKIGGLYFAGEVLDLDADTGGYNLQLALSTGRLAGLLKKSPGAPDFPEPPSAR